VRFLSLHVCRVSCVVCRVSCVVCRVSCVVCRVSCVSCVCRVSCVVCRVSCVVCRASCVVCRVSYAVTNTTHSPAAVAVAVVRDGARPTLPASARPREFVDLLRACWSQDPTARPSFFVRTPAPHPVRNATHAVLLTWQHVTFGVQEAMTKLTGLIERFGGGGNGGGDGRAVNVNSSSVSLARSTDSRESDSEVPRARPRQPQSDDGYFSRESWTIASSLRTRHSGVSTPSTTRHDTTRHDTTRPTTRPTTRHDTTRHAA
jgi:hypothetical protein